MMDVLERNVRAAVSWSAKLTLIIVCSRHLLVYSIEPDRVGAIKTQEAILNGIVSAGPSIKHKILFFYSSKVYHMI